MASIKNQVKEALQSINVIDNMEKRISLFEKYGNLECAAEQIGKKEFKNHGISERVIISIETMKSKLNQGVIFAEWCKDNYNVKLLKDINPEMAKEFIATKQAEGCSKSTISQYINSIQKLSYAVEEKFHVKEGFLNGMDLSKEIVVGNKDNVHNRLYTNEQIHQIIEAVPDKYKPAVMTQYYLGLRLHEMLNINVVSNNFIDKEGNLVDKNLGKIDLNDKILLTDTKGGRARSAMPVELDYHKFFIDLKQQCIDQGIEKPFQWITKSGYNAMLRRVTEKLGLPVSSKTHEFRKAYCEDLYHKFEAEKLESTGKSELTKEEKREIAREVVHYIGHGKMRDDLVKRYLGGLVA